jgi:hypothetical protein
MAQTGLIKNAILDPAANDPSKLNPDGTPIAPASPSAAPATPGTTTPGAATSYTPALNTLNPGTDTVEGRVNNIVKSGSPLIEQARTSAAQTANARGLLNSSIAVGEGEKAALNAALPIASQDAQASLAVSQHNQDTTNQSLQFGAGAENDANLQKLRGDQSVQLANIDAGNKQILQSSASASAFFSQVSTAIGEILKEPNIGVEQKQQLVQKQIELLKNGLSVIGGIGNLDLTGLLTFPAAAAPEAKPAGAASSPTEEASNPTPTVRFNNG